MTRDQEYLGLVVAFVTAIVLVFDLFFDPEPNTLPIHIEKAQSLCEQNDGLNYFRVEGGRLFYETMVVSCNNGAGFTVKTQEIK